MVMINYLVAAMAAILLLAAGVPANAETAQTPAVRQFPSSVGEVVFKHQAHIQERGIACAECHHQINAKKLATPHPDYFKSSWINCEICHNESGKAGESGKPARGVYACSACHRSNPQNIVDETLSAKVVIHRSCWKCHQVGAGKEASKGCELCHSGKKT